MTDIQPSLDHLYPSADSLRESVMAFREQLRQQLKIDKVLTNQSRVQYSAADKRKFLQGGRWNSADPDWQREQCNGPIGDLYVLIVQLECDIEKTLGLGVTVEEMADCTTTTGTNQ